MTLRQQLEALMSQVKTQREYEAVDTACRILDGTYVVRKPGPRNLKKIRRMAEDLHKMLDEYAGG
jgi:hypothetical protein